MKHKRPVKVAKREPAVPGVTLPATIWRHTHGAMARLDGMEEASRQLLATGRFPFRIVNKPAVTSPLISAKGLSGLLVGPDGQPLGGTR